MNKDSDSMSVYKQNSPTLFVPIYQGEYNSILFTGLKSDNSYFIYNNDSDSDDIAFIENAAGEKCSFNVDKQKPMEDTDKNCDKLSIEDANKLYTEFYDFLNEYKLSRDEVVKFFDWLNAN